MASHEYTEYDFVQLGFLQMGLRHRIDLVAHKCEQFIIKAFLLVLKLFPQNNLQNRLRLRRSVGLPTGFFPDDIRSGAHSYIVNRHFAETILKLNNPAFLTIDSLYGSLTWNHHFRMIRASRSWVGQTNSASSIKISHR
jgi:hypothetical protein